MLSFSERWGQRRFFLLLWNRECCSHHPYFLITAILERVVRYISLGREVLSYLSHSPQKAAGAGAGHLSGASSRVSMPRGALVHKPGHLSAAGDHSRGVPGTSKPLNLCHPKPLLWEHPLSCGGPSCRQDPGILKRHLHRVLSERRIQHIDAILHKCMRCLWAVGSSCGSLMRWSWPVILPPSSALIQCPWVKLWRKSAERSQHREPTQGMQKAPCGFDWAFLGWTAQSLGLLSSFSPFSSGLLHALLPFPSF